MVTILIPVALCGYLTGCTSLLVMMEVLEFGTLFAGQDATLEADLVLIDEKLTGGEFTFCFINAGTECGGAGTDIEAGTARMGSLGVMCCCTESKAGYIGFRYSFILQTVDLYQ